MMMKSKLINLILLRLKSDKMKQMNKLLFQMKQNQKNKKNNKKKQKKKKEGMTRTIGDYYRKYRNYQQLLIGELPEW